MPRGAKHSLFEVVLVALGQAEDLDDADSIAAAVRATRLETVMGMVDFSTGPVPSVSKTPVAGAQWQVREGDPVFEIVTNDHSPMIPLTAQMKPISGAA